MAGASQISKLQLQRDRAVSITGKKPPRGTLSTSAANPAPEKPKKPEWSYVVKLNKMLKEEWSKSKVNMKRCGMILDELKVNLAKYCYLPVKREKCKKEEVLLAREMLEIAVAFSISLRDLAAFERNMAQLKCYYFDYKHIVEDSPSMYKLLGLNLLFLLSANKVSEFYTELERLPAEVLKDNEFIKPILAIEQYFIEGRYNKIFEMNGCMQSRSYQLFMNIFLETVRNKIGECMEQAYLKMSVEDAAERLRLTPAELKAFANKRKWSLSTSGYYYMPSKIGAVKEHLPSHEIAGNFLTYAKEMEQIV